MKHVIDALKASKRKANHQRDNWKRRSLLATDLIVRWLEWARMHGHLEHAEGIVKDSRELLANKKVSDSPPLTSTDTKTANGEFAAPLG